MAHFGAIYGGVLAFFTLGSGLGPWIMAHAFDTFQVYSAGLIALGIALCFAIIMTLTLGRYAYPPGNR
jgi:hypothetical protein